MILMLSKYQNVKILVTNKINRSLNIIGFTLFAVDSWWNVQPKPKCFHQKFTIVFSIANMFKLPFILFVIECYACINIYDENTE